MALRVPIDAEWRRLSSDQQALRTVYTPPNGSNSEIGSMYGYTEYVASASGDSQLCHTCNASLRKPSPKLPECSAAAGIDIGYLPSTLPQLTYAEKLLISRTRLYMGILKLTSTPRHCTERGAYEQLAGHTCAFPHDGPTTLLEALPRPDIIPEVLSVSFVGTRQQYARIGGQPGSASRERLMTALAPVLQVRPVVVYQWLRFLKAHNPFYQTVVIQGEDDPQFVERMQQSSARLVDHSWDNIIDDTAILNVQAAVGADAANVRGLNAAPAIVLPPATTDSPAINFDFTHDSSVVYPDPSVVHDPVLQALESALRPSAPVLVHRSADATNEFTDNDALIYGAFPHLFPLGTGLPLKLKGSVPLSFCAYLMHHASNRFSQETALGFLLFDQYQRHSIANAVKFRVPIEHESAFQAMVTAPGFLDRLIRAKSNPGSVDSMQISRIASRLIVLTGSDVPFTAQARGTSLSKMFAMVQLYGLPAVFLTIAPNDLNSALLLRLSSACAADTEFRPQSYVLPPSAERARTVFANPVAAAILYDRVMTALYSQLLCIHSAEHQKKETAPVVAERPNGALGVPLAFVNVTENQGKGDTGASLLLPCLCCRRLNHDHVCICRYSARTRSCVDSWSQPRDSSAASRQSGSMGCDFCTYRCHDSRTCTRQYSRRSCRSRCCCQQY